MANVVPIREWKDSFANFLSGFGVMGRDKAMSQHWTLNLLTPQQLEFAYRSDWCARKIVQIVAFDSARAWRSWEATQKQIKALEDAEKQFGYQNKLMLALDRKSTRLNSS